MNEKPDYAWLKLQNNLLHEDRLLLKKFIIDYELYKDIDMIAEMIDRESLELYGEIRKLNDHEIPDNLLAVEKILEMRD